MIKRAAVAALTAIVLFAGMPAKSVMAADTEPLHTAVQVTGKVDKQKITYKLTLDKTTVTDGRIAVLYDPAVVTLDNPSVSLSFSDSDVNKNFEDGLLKGLSVAFVNDSPKKLSGSFLSLKFSVKTGIAGQDTAIKTVVYGLNNDDEVVLPETVLEDVVRVGREKLTDPELKSLNQTIIGVNVKWVQDKNADGYEVFRSTSPNGPFTKVATVKSGNYWDITVKNNKTYYYKVAAYRGSGATKEYSKESNVLSIKVKKFLGLFG
jgi:hypothetical protein